MCNNKTIRDKIKDGYYTPSSNFPNPPQKKICRFCGETIYNAVRFGDVGKYCSSCGEENGTKYTEEVDEYKELKRKYNEEEVKLMCEFKVEALKETGLLTDSRADKIYNYAWSKGHSAGLLEVLGELEELSEVVFYD